MFCNILHKSFNQLVQHSRSYVRRSRRQPIFSGLASDSNVEGKNYYSEDIENIDAEDLSIYDIDHENAHKSHKQFEREQFEHKERIRHLTVGNKYFRQKLPNFLTWAEKQQIRFLHNQDPIEWSFERLADSFPADSEIIAKICKSNWQPADDKRIQRHDDMVQKNWKLFNENKFENLSTHLQDHLKKFSKRGNINNAVLSSSTADESTTNQLKTKIPEPNSKEFLSIITSCQKYQPKLTDGNNALPASEKKLQKIHKVLPNDGTYLMSEIIDRKPVMFKPTTNSNESNLEHHQHLLEQGNLLQNPSGTGVVFSSAVADNPFRIKKFSSIKIASEEDEMKAMSMPAIKENIKIPKKFYKEGATYKLGDCYYDDDGEFLYRVPGMTGNN